MRSVLDFQLGMCYNWLSLSRQVSRSFPEQIGLSRGYCFGNGARKVRTLANFVCCGHYEHMVL